jgi:hypothetical protein
MNSNYLYKFISGVLLLSVGILGVAYAKERYDRSKVEQALNNSIAQLQGAVKETQNSYSVVAIESENLKHKLATALQHNKDLLSTIEDRDEQVLALEQISIKWKNKYFEIKNASTSVVSSDGTTVVDVITPDCQTCLSSVRLRVDFDQEKDYLKVQGFTLTNPAYAEIGVEWTKPLKLNLILTKKENQFRVYVDSDNSDMVPSEIELFVDPSVLSLRWYERIGIGADASAGEGVSSGLRVFYDAFKNFYVGPNVVFYYDGNNLKKMYGISAGWYMFR